MRILLDTHIFLWWLQDSQRLKSETRKAIQYADTVYISSISIWEAVIKTQLGKLAVSIPDLATAISTEGFCELPFTATHAAKIKALPGHHRDPFDRALIAQALCEPLRLLTADTTLSPYSELVEVC